MGEGVSVIFGVCGPVVIRTMSVDTGARGFGGRVGCCGWMKVGFVLLLLLLLPEIQDCKNCSRFVR